MTKRTLKTLMGIGLGLAVLAGQPSFAMASTSQSIAGAAFEAVIPAAVVELTSDASLGLHGAQSQVKWLAQKNKKKPKKQQPREVPEINAASGAQALALLIGVLLLGAERMRRYS